jgi:hypothetical protein
MSNTTTARLHKSNIVLPAVQGLAFAMPTYTFQQSLILNNGDLSNRSNNSCDMNTQQHQVTTRRCKSTTRIRERSPESHRMYLQQVKSLPQLTYDISLPKERRQHTTRETQESQTVSEFNIMDESFDVKEMIKQRERRRKEEMQLLNKKLSVSRVKNHQQKLVNYTCKYHNRSNRKDDSFMNIREVLGL